MSDQESLVLRVTGMTCNNCVNHVQKALLAAPGVASAVVNLKKMTAEVRGTGLRHDRLTQAVRDVGYDATEHKPGTDTNGGSGWKFWRR